MKLHTIYENEYEDLEDIDQFGDEDPWVEEMREFADTHKPWVVFANMCPKIEEYIAEFDRENANERSDILVFASNRSNNGVLESESIEDLQNFHEIIGPEYTNPPEPLSDWLNEADLGAYEGIAPRIMVWVAKRRMLEDAIL